MGLFYDEALVREYYGYLDELEGIKNDIDAFKKQVDSTKQISQDGLILDGTVDLYLSKEQFENIDGYIKTLEGNLDDVKSAINKVIRTEEMKDPGYWDLVQPYGGGDISGQYRV